MARSATQYVPGTVTVCLNFMCVMQSQSLAQWACIAQLLHPDAAGDGSKKCEESFHLCISAGGQVVQQPLQIQVAGGQPAAGVLQLSQVSC